jgi:predicted nucleic acid-binding protein
MTLIDTSAWIDFLRKAGDPTVKKQVAAYIDLGDAAYCGPVEFELLVGARPSEIGDIRKGLGFSFLLDFPLSCWHEAAKIEKELRGKGVTVPRDDVFVAAVAVHHGVCLYTADPHFTLMRDKGGIPLGLV